MKTQSTSAKTFFTFAFILTIGIFSVSAQNQSVMAVSQNGNSVESSSLQIAIHALEAATPKFLIGLVNTGSEPVTIKLKDSEGKNIHKPIFFNSKSLAATFDMSHMQEGTYTIEVKSKSETYRYHIQLDNKVMRTVEINPTILAKVKH
jgi:hypothetical protein